MSGRTARVDARDLLDRAETILFEADEIRAWLLTLHRRSRGILQATRKLDPKIRREVFEDLAELERIFAAVGTAHDELTPTIEAIKRRAG